MQFSPPFATAPYGATKLRPLRRDSDEVQLASIGSGLGRRGSLPGDPVVYKPVNLALREDVHGVAPFCSTTKSCLNAFAAGIMSTTARCRSHVSLTYSASWVVVR